MSVEEDLGKIPVKPCQCESTTIATGWMIPSTSRGINLVIVIKT